MELSIVWKVVILGLAHWMLVSLALDNLARRERVLGGQKSLWALVILFLTCFGSLFYLILHPQVQSQGYPNRD